MKFKQDQTVFRHTITTEVHLIQAWLELYKIKPSKKFLLQILLNERSIY